MNEKMMTLGSSALAVQPIEQELNDETALVVQRAESMVITTDAQYAAAAEMTKAVKRVAKKVKEYWEPLRVAAKTTYDNVLARKKEMTDPLDSAEKILKKKMSDFTMEKERKRRAQEEAMRKLAAAEADRKLEEAARAEASGDMAGAEYAMAEAEVMEGVSISGSIAAQTPKATGVSRSRTWKITGIDSSKVPVIFGGVEIRPIDERAVMRIIKESKGTVQIPGIRYEESVAISVRA